MYATYATTLEKYPDDNLPQIHLSSSSSPASMHTCGGGACAESFTEDQALPPGGACTWTGCCNWPVCGPDPGTVHGHQNALRREVLLAREGAAVSAPAQPAVLCSRGVVPTCVVCVTGQLCRLRHDERTPSASATMAMSWLLLRQMRRKATLVDAAALSIASSPSSVRRASPTVQRVSTSPATRAPPRRGSTAGPPAACASAPVPVAEHGLSPSARRQSESCPLA